MMQTNQREAEELLQLGLQALVNNRIDFAKKYFCNAAVQGDEHANRLLMFLCCSRDQSLARDIILCAERLI
ncbi:MAG: hypothetical protein PVG30_04490 [Gammaproteobacteria bacterium]|jgi:hypothetical protein